MSSNSDDDDQDEQDLVETVNRGVPQRPAMRKTKTGIRGVSVLLSGKFAAQASRGGKQHWLGTFRTTKAAAAAIREFKQESQRIAEEERLQRMALDKVLQSRGGDPDADDNDDPRTGNSRRSVLGRPFQSAWHTTQAHADVVKRTPRCPHCSMPWHFHMRLVNGNKVVIFSWTMGGPGDTFPIVGIYFDKGNRVGVGMTWSLTGEPYRGAGFHGQWLDFGTLERTRRTEKDPWLSHLLEEARCQSPAVHPPGERCSPLAALEDGDGDDEEDPSEET